MRWILYCLIISFLFFSPSWALAGDVVIEHASMEAIPDNWLETHALAMHGQPKHGLDFQSFDYANPQTPKGGELKRAALGSFDSLNPFLIMGQPPQSLSHVSYFDSLMRRSWDEPFTMYPLIAKKLRVAPDRSAITFFLDQSAEFHDKTPITTSDVIYSFKQLKQHGRPNARRIYKLVDKITVHSPQALTFHLGEGYDQETVLILSLMPILSQKYWSDKDFSKTTLEKPLGSGPYEIESFEPGRQIVYKRRANYWARNLPSNRGHHNFDRITYDYYRDDTVAFQAFVGGAYDMRREWTAHQWQKNYDFKAIENGGILKAAFDNRRPQWARFMVFNMRKEIFQDRRVRKALTLAFDFSWVNTTLFDNAYKRLNSIFANSELAHQSDVLSFEQEILSRHKGVLAEDVFSEGQIQFPESADPKVQRQQLRQASQLLKEAGWVLKEGVLTHSETGKVFEFEILLDNPANEKIALYYKQTLKKLGINMVVRTVDSAQYAGRLQEYDYGMIMHYWRNSLSPGTEQAVYWGSQAALANGGLNYSGVSNTAIDDIIQVLTTVTTREQLVSAARALDRVIMHEYIGIPLYYSDKDYIAFKAGLDFPKRVSLYGPVIETWWAKQE